MKKKIIHTLKINLVKLLLKSKNDDRGIRTLALADQRLKLAP